MTSSTIPGQSLGLAMHLGLTIFECGIDLPVCDAQLLLKCTKGAPEALIRAHNAPALLAVGARPAWSHGAL